MCMSTPLRSADALVGMMNKEADEGVGAPI
jgi:hypothetical protein